MVKGEKIMADKETLKNAVNVIKQILADFHLHTWFSDGAKSPEEMIEYAKKNGVQWLSFTDHNTLQACIDLWKKHGEDLSKPCINVDGVNIVSGVEVTCRVMPVANTKGNSAKVHLCVYGADMSPESPLVRLMEIKRKNDLEYDLARLNYLLSLKPNIHISQDEILEWFRKNGVDGEPSNQQIMDFLDYKNIDLGISSSTKLSRLLEGMPPVQRLNIDAEMLIRVAHASGGKVVFAHPAHNLKRTSDKLYMLETLLRAGLDGFEMLYNGANTETAHLIDIATKRYAKKKSIIYTGGSDTHSLAEGNTIGKWSGKNNRNKPITVESQEKGLIKVINALLRGYEAGDGVRWDYDAVAERYVSHCRTRAAEAKGEVSPAIVPKTKNKTPHSRNRYKGKPSAEEYYATAEDEGMSFLDD